MTKENKVSRKDVLPMIQSISELTEKIAKIVATIPEGYIKNSYETSVKNIRSKNENFLEVKSRDTTVRPQTSEEKAAITAMLAEMRKNAPVSETTGTSDKSDESATSEETENTPDAPAEGTQRVSKKNRKHN